MKSSAEAIGVTEKFAQLAARHASLGNIDESSRIVSDDIARHSMNLKMLSRDIHARTKKIDMKLVELGFV